MKKRKFGSGGMPSMAASVASGNRVSKRVGAETKAMMGTKRSGMPPIGDSVASGNRMSKENAKDMRAVKNYAKGGKVKSIDVDMKGLEEASRPNTSMPKADLETKVLEGRNLAATRKREEADTAPKKQSFGSAFAAARKRGDKTFSWNGGSYGTKMAGEGSAKPTAKPAANPYNAKTQMRDIIRNLDTNNAKLSDAQMERYQKGLDADADASLAKIKADKAKAAAKSRFSISPSALGKATTKAISEAVMRGSIRTPGMAKGGSVSKRADGCATKGKTKGKMV